MKAKRPPSLAPADIRAAAFAYLERFDASPERLRAVLRRRIRAYLKRRRLGPFARGEDADKRLKAMTALRRRGFSRAAAEAALAED